MQRLVPAKNDPSADVVYTPRALAQKIVDHFQPKGLILDPCRGGGAFYDCIKGEKDYCELSEGRDFFDYARKVDWIITNPPWSKFRPFLEHSLKLADNIVFLVTLNHYSTKRRLRVIKDAGFGFAKVLALDTPKEFPQSGFQVGAVHIQRGYEGPIYLEYLE